MDERFARGLRPACLRLALLGVVVLAGCAPTEQPVPARSVWIFGADAPPFDPGGPPDPRRWAIERPLSFGLLESDTNGTPVPAAARVVEVSADSLVYTFRLRDDLRFVDGAACRAADFAAALTLPLGRTDHATRAWQLAAVRGVDRVRAGRPLPPLGIETPDDRTLVLRLAVTDPDLLRKLAIPGTSSPWKRGGAPGWAGAVGIGPLRVAAADTARRFVLVGPGAAARRAVTDTLLIRFVPSLTRVRSLLRDGQPHLVWPLPPGLLAEPVPSGFAAVARDANPARRLVLVQRADLPPTTRLPARAALAHGINHTDVIRALGREGREVRQWFPGAGAFGFPSLDPGEIEQWRERGRLGRSFHVEMAYDDRGPAAVVARLMQGEWAAHDVYVELRALRGRRRHEEPLTGRSHLVLFEWRDLLATPGGMLAPMVMPLRGPAVGAVRTGWRTREFDRWIQPRVPGAPFDPGAAQRRLEEERILLPLADLAWVWLERSGGPAASFHPALGPSCPMAAGVAAASR